jgi:hypothetical protein
MMWYRLLGVAGRDQVIEMNLINTILVLCFGRFVVRNDVCEDSTKDKRLVQLAAPLNTVLNNNKY